MARISGDGGKLRRWLLAGAVLLVAWKLGRILAAPGVPATCTKVLELAELAGERVDDSERAACEAHYGRLRTSRGLIGWARLSWCTRNAKTIPEAGAC